MKRRVLLVDDDESVLLTLKAVLELHRFDVDTAISATDACAKLQTGTYEMVVTDIRMETEDAGFQVVHTAQQQTYRPVTAVLTAYPPPEQVCRNQRVGSLLVKPIGTTELVRQLEALLQTRRSDPSGR
jgi:DNA-binding NtrC family response regulator